MRKYNIKAPYTAKIMQRTASNAGTLNGRTPIEHLLGDTPDISEYLDFGFYDWIVFKQDAGVREGKISRFLGVASGVGSLMSYWILPDSGIPKVRSTVQRLTTLERETDAMKERMLLYNGKIRSLFGDNEFVANENGSPIEEGLEDLMDDPDFLDEFYRTFDNGAIEDADKADDTPDSFDPYLHMEIALDRGGEHPEFARVKKRLRTEDGTPIGRASTNPLLDSRLYEVEYADGYTTAMTANLIAENMFAQVDEDGHREVFIDEIIDVRSNKDAINEEDAFHTMNIGVKTREQTTAGWEVLIQWNDGSTA